MGSEIARPLSADGITVERPMTCEFADGLVDPIDQQLQNLTSVRQIRVVAGACNVTNLLVVSFERSLAA